MIKILKLSLMFWFWFISGILLIIISLKYNESLFNLEFIFGVISLLMALIMINSEEIEDLEKRIKELENRKS